MDTAVNLSRNALNGFIRQCKIHQFKLLLNVFLETPLSVLEVHVV